MNEFRENKKEKKERGVNKLFDFDFKITRESIPRFLPFVMFIVFLIILYIANKYYAEKSYLEEAKLKQKVKDLRAESLTTKAQLINKTKYSDIEARAKEIGLEEMKEPPKRILVKDE
ncbi:MAG TPA: FtsL-like putative cell division protein [Bacteroidia bacterium]|nr:hypothetical protein [Sphingobacteriales bacterium]HPD65265.1 FtsL-like putative cell division protein [Bacteroidia bacterium]HRS58644.1 FtsL-like putative cell division protein [Bacteroidia bacterium]HRU67851.1 FtsL-like putative cell division protein [Bacteroidia bacterium]